MNSRASGEASPSVLTSWAALVGRWEFPESEVRYLGPGGPSGSSPAYGLALGSGILRDGEIRFDVKLNRNERTTAGAVLGFRSLQAPYYLAQIGAYERAYAVSEYTPDRGWRALGAAGDLKNLDPAAVQSVRVTLEGQLLGLLVNGVPVLEVVLPHPPQGGGTGLFAWDDAPVVFSRVGATTKAPKAFVIMPFKEPFDTLYREVIKPEAEALEVEILRVDEIDGPGAILDAIREQIETAHLVVAEISTKNPNVFYELGYAHALDKPSVLLVRKDSLGDLPFDVRGLRAIVYEDTIAGIRLVQDLLRRHLMAVLRGQSADHRL